MGSSQSHTSADAQVRSPQSPRFGEWRDIASAPKIASLHESAKPFIGWCPDPEAPGGGDQRVCWWEPKLRRGTWWSDRDMPEAPTLWMPLHPPPSDIVGGGGWTVGDRARVVSDNEYADGAEDIGTEFVVEGLREGSRNRLVLLTPKATRGFDGFYADRCERLPAETAPSGPQGTEAALSVHDEQP